jgi:hypothetical protein
VTKVVRCLSIQQITLLYRRNSVLTVIHTHCTLSDTIYTEFRSRGVSPVSCSLVRGCGSRFVRDFWTSRITHRYCLRLLSGIYSRQSLRTGGLYTLDPSDPSIWPSGPDLPIAPDRGASPERRKPVQGSGACLLTVQRLPWLSILQKNGWGPRSPRYPLAPAGGHRTLAHDDLGHAACLLGTCCPFLWASSGGGSGILFQLRRLSPASACLTSRGQWAFPDPCRR